MMHIEFATCCRTRALDFLRAVYPDAEVTDTPDCAGPLLDYVERDVVRIQDPMMHGKTIAVIPSTNFDEALLADIQAAGAVLTRFVESHQ